MVIERYTRPEMAEIWSEKSRFDLWLQIELLICESQVKLGVFPEQAISRMKKRAAYNIAKIHEREETNHHEVVAFVDEVCSSLKEDARYFHRGVTSSDVMDTALAIQLTKSGILILHDLNLLLGTLEARIPGAKDQVMAGRTHGMHAEPITFAFKLAVWFAELERHRERMLSAVETIRTGKISGAVGTFANLHPEIEEHVCTELGLRPAQISTQIIQRDRHAHFITMLALLGSTLEKIAIEIRHLQRTEVHEVEEPFGVEQAGSSAMPHKRNPVFCENVAGLARLLRANALAAMENIALWHERDISHSSVERIILPDSCILIDFMLHRMVAIINGLRVFPENMLRNLALSHGLIFSGKVLVALMDKGLERTRAYELVQIEAMNAHAGKGTFKDLLQANKAVRKVLSKDEIEACFDFDLQLRNLPEIFKRLGL